MARGVKATPEQEKVKLNADLKTIQQRMKKDAEKEKEIKDKLLAIEVKEQSEFFELAKKLANDKGVSLIDLIKPLDESKKESV